MNSSSNSSWVPRPVYVIALTFAIGMAFGAAFDRRVLSGFVPTSGLSPKAIPEFRLMAEAWNTIQQFSVLRFKTKPRDLTYGAISGMVDSLGDSGHSTFLPPGMANKVNDMARGQFKGIGAEVQMRAGHVVIIAPIDGSPAQKAHLRAGDIILRVDGQDISGLSLEEVVDRVSGPAGSTVTLTILQPRSGRTRDVTLTRAAITLHNVTWQKLPGTSVVHVRLAGFTQGVTDNLRKALESMKQEAVTGLILDLRNNPGGLLDEAVGVASLFIKEGNVLLEKDAQGKVNPVAVKGGAVAPTVPMTVLVNRGSASASEIVAGALRDARKATLVGDTTFGTGTVLNAYGLSDGSALLLAFKEWLTPSGETIWRKGLTPGVLVTLPPDIAPLSPEAERSLTPEELRESKDEQVLRALELLTGNGKLGNRLSPQTTAVA